MEAPNTPEAAAGCSLFHDMTYQCWWGPCSGPPDYYFCKPTILPVAHVRTELGYAAYAVCFKLLGHCLNNTREIPTNKTWVEFPSTHCDRTISRHKITSVCCLANGSKKLHLILARPTGIAHMFVVE